MEPALGHRPCCPSTRGETACVFPCAAYVNKLFRASHPSGFVLQIQVSEMKTGESSHNDFETDETELS